MYQRIRQLFYEKFQTNPLIVRAPGRVNIIGEHTDYNEGFVLPAAIDKAVFVGISPRTDGEIHLSAEAFRENFILPLSGLSPQRVSWVNYVLGGAGQLLKRGYPLKGFNLLLDGDVPLGAGLSSSAAVECAVIVALNECFRFGIEKMDIVHLAREAEHEYTGVKCGIMDMFASMYGRKDHVIKLDCRSLEYDYVPLRLEGLKILLLNTNVKHSLASTAYNERREQCEQGVRWIQEFQPSVRSLRDASVGMLEQYVFPRDPLVYRRCRFVLEENRRLLDAYEQLQNGKLALLGRNMFASHHALSRDYEVSCAELDFLVSAVKDIPGVLGARMMGGGFGGCTINLVREQEINALIERVGPAYSRATGLTLTAYVVDTAEGASICTG